MYGTRQAAQNWQNSVKKVMTKSGFAQARSSPCLFHHAERGIITMVHGDDFVSTGPGDSLTWMQGILSKEFEITTTTIGPEKEDEKQVKVLNRTITYTSEGIEYEPDPRHAELIVKELKLEDCNPVVAPGINEEPDCKDAEEKLSPEQAS
eukprot:12424142-Karenia_brevis.AAC.1